MAHLVGKRQSWGPTCPSGGTWYACTSGTFFVGCCDEDPCSVTCPSGSLHPAGFNPKFYGKFPDVTCGTGSQAYSCTAGSTFLGCCKTNACVSGCQDGDLEPAFLSRPDQKIAYGVEKPKDKSNVPVIAGAAGGGGLLLIVIIALVAFCIYRKKKSTKSKAYVDSQQTAFLSTPSTQGLKDYHSPDVASNWSSPDPNAYHQDGFQNHAYAHGQQHQSYDHVPQEMPGEPLPPSKLTGRAFGHKHGPSELSETADPSELESPNPQHSSPALRSQSGSRNSPIVG